MIQVRVAISVAFIDNNSTHSFWLKNGGKYYFMGHRRFLDKDHRYRKDRISFDGTQEMEPAPTMLSGSEVKMYTEGLEFEFGKTEANLKKSKSRKAEDEQQPWKKDSIFFQLPYWEHLLLRHNLDLMHIENNVFNNVLGTVLNLDGKTKDNLKARRDLEVLGIRPELHPQQIGPDKIYLPPACFSMTLKEKDDFLKVLKRVKVPDGYASNLSRCIQLKQRKIIGLKSHDAHIMMQQLLPIALRASLPKKVVLPLIRLCCFFREICSKVLDVDELERLETEIAVTLCDLERIFPPSFFTVMVHLVSHLAAEAKIGGPIHYRWMYPIERYLKRLKSYVRNKAHPEASIAEGYMAEECLTFCSRYFESVETIFNRPARNVENASGSITNIELDQKSWTQAHRYVLFNTDEIIPFREEHKQHLKRQSRPRRLTDEALHKNHMEKFCDWFRLYVALMDDTRKQLLSDKIKWLAQGPNTEAKRFKRFVVNGFKFRVKSSEETKKTQNSGVCVPVEGGNMYYGVLQDIVELNYFDKMRYVLFKCDWADVNTSRGHKIDEYGFVLVNFSRLIHTGERLNDEPFILASQVYYVKDPRDKGWLVAVRTKARDVFDVGNGEREEDDGDTYHDNEPYELIIEDDTDGNDSLDWSRNDATGSTVSEPLTCEGQLIEDPDSDFDV